MPLDTYTDNNFNSNNPNNLPEQEPELTQEDLMQDEIERLSTALQRSIDRDLYKKSLLEQLGAIMQDYVTFADKFGTEELDKMHEILKDWYPVNR